MPKHRSSTKWFSTTEAARLCGLSQMTIIRRFDAGDLKGFKVPGSRFRRIPRESLVEFAARYGIPLELGGAPAGPEIAEQPKDRPRRALVVEDDRRMAALIERVVSADGWEVRVARNGFDAGFLAGSFLPELIILDVLLPGMDGREACRQMRRDPRLANSKILAVTALRDERSVEEVFAAGADGYLAKPFSLGDLRAKIAALAGTPAGPEGTAPG